MGSNYGWIEIVFIATVALGLGGWQLWSVSREIRRDREARSAKPPGHAVGEHPLDDE
jgi:hypothetical protein